MPVTVTKRIFLTWEPIRKIGTIASDKNWLRNLKTMVGEAGRGPRALSLEKGLSEG